MKVYWNICLTVSNPCMGWNERIIRCCKVVSGPQRPQRPQVYISHHLHSHGSLFRFCPGEKVDWRLLAPNSLNFFSAKKYICLTSLLARHCSIILKKIYFFVIDKSTQSRPFWDRNWVCKSFSLTTVGCVEELHLWEEREGYCNFSQNVLKKERGSFCNLLWKPKCMHS